LHAKAKRELEVKIPLIIIVRKINHTIFRVSMKNSNKILEIGKCADFAQLSKKTLLSIEQIS
jgi:hypothetical protein